MRLIVLILSAIALRAAAAPVDVAAADVAVPEAGNADEALEARGNWCLHSDISCF